MRMLRTFAWLLLAALVPVQPAASQTCQGAASFRGGMWRLGAGATFSDGTTSYTAQGAVGSPKSLYATAEIGTTKVDAVGGGSSSSSTDFGGSLGYQLPISDSPAEFCPFALVSYSSFSGVNATTWGVGGGIGYRLKGSDELDFVPAAGLRWESVSVSALGRTATSSGTLWWLSAGLVIKKTWTVAPIYVIPNEKGAKNYWGIGIGLNFGN